jgi:hypothetical protein
MANKSPFNRPRPPRVVHVCGHKIKVKVVPYLEDSGAELVGAFNGETKTIYLMKGCEWKSVLLHEITHAILFFTGASEGLTITKEESIVLSLEHGLGSLIF